MLCQIKVVNPGTTFITQGNYTLAVPSITQPSVYGTSTQPNVRGNTQVRGSVIKKISNYAALKRHGSDRKTRRVPEETNNDREEAKQAPASPKERREFKLNDKFNLESEIQKADSSVANVSVKKDCEYTLNNFV